MLDMGFLAAAVFAGQLSKATPELALTKKQFRVQVGMSPPALCQCIHPLIAYRYFDALDGIGNQQPQFPVEDIEIEDIIEGGSFAKAVFTIGKIGFLERDPVTT